MLTEDQPVQKPRTPLKDAAPRRRRPARALLFLVNIGLVVSFVLMGFLYVRERVPVPRFLLTQVNGQLAESGFYAEADSIDFYLPGTLIASDVRFYADGHTDPLATFEVARLDIDPHALLRRELNLQQISFAGFQLNCPAELSPSGVTEEVISKARLNLRPAANGWQIDPSSARVNEAHLIISGHLPPPSQEEPKEPYEWQEVASHLGDAVRWREYLRKAPGLQVELHLRPGADDLAVQFTARADGFHDERIGSITRPDARGTIVFGNSGSREATGQIEAAAIEWGEWKAQEVTAGVNWNGKLETNPVNLELPSGYIEKITSPIGELKGIQVTAAPVGEKSRIYLALNQDDGEFLRTDALIDWNTLSTTAEITARLNPNFVLRHDLAASMGFSKDIFFHDPPVARAHIEASLEEGLISAEARVVSGKVEIDEVLLDRADAQARFASNFFDVDEMHLSYGDFDTRGSFQTDLNDQSYRIAFDGSVRPTHISPWFRDWWSNLWDELVPKDPIHGDIVLHGEWGSPPVLNAWVNGANIAARGVDFEHMEGHLVIGKNHFEVHGAKLVRPEGEAHGDVAWRLDRENRRAHDWRVNIESTLDPSAVAPALAPWGPGIFAPFAFDDSPFIRVTGTAASPDASLQFEATSETALHYEGVALDSLALLGDWNEHELTLDDIRFGLGGGTGNGNARVWQENGGEQLAFDMVIQEAEFDAVTALMGNLNGELAESGWQATPGGLIDLTMSVSGQRDDPLSFSGNGALTISDADFGQVHLFGTLSRMLSAVPLPLNFTSLDLDKAESTFVIDQKRLWFPDVKLEGPSAGIDGKGVYQLDKDELDFSLRIYLMRNSRVPFLSMLLAPVTQPLAHVTEIRLTGSPADPEWRFLLGPRNLMDSIRLPEQTVQVD